MAAGLGGDLVGFAESRRYNLGGGVMRLPFTLLLSLWVVPLCGAPVEAIREYRTANAARILEQFAELLAIPNVASDASGIRRNADYLVEQFRARGVAMKLLTLPGAPPIVFGEMASPGARRTLGVYVHYDGEPTDPADWVTAGPWKPELYSARHDEGGQAIPFPKPGARVDPEWRIYGRSAGDDKAPLVALLTVLDVFRQEQIEPGWNLKFFFDGEEESGSPHLAEYLRTYREDVDDIDLWLFCDGPVHQSRRPQVLFGVRGIAGLEVTLYGANRPLHSGHYGNWAPVPGVRLAHLLASMKDDSGRVLIDGFYDTVAPLGEEEQAALRKLPSYDQELRRQLGLAATEMGNASLSERILLPALTIRGISSGNTGESTRNIIPSTATAALGIRLVAGNAPEHMMGLVEEHIRRQGFHIVREDPDTDTRLTYPKIAKVVRDEGYPAARTPMNSPLAREVIAAVNRVLDEPALEVPALGGTLPLYLFTDVLQKPVLILPIANHDNNQHAENENLRLANLWYGIDVFASVLSGAESPQ
jgi:acetylornithine deacetylase/succinyl-diaminopimelate desuccinylase-like protein